MMRHTTDYRVYRAVWCSETGLPSGVGVVDGVGVGNVNVSGNDPSSVV